MHGYCDDDDYDDGNNDIKISHNSCCNTLNQPEVKLRILRVYFY